MQPMLFLINHYTIIDGSITNLVFCLLTDVLAKGTVTLTPVDNPWYHQVQHIKKTHPGLRWWISAER